MFDTVEALLTIQITKEAGVIHRLRTYYRKSLINYNEKQDCLSRVVMAKRHRWKTAKIKL